MAKKLYYQDAYIKEFHANIVKQDKDNDGSSYVVLDQTAFYPTGGGQPFDTGWIGEAEVRNVEEIEGEIRHYLNRPLQEDEVNCVIHWERRFDHMQQHSGQHILTAAFENLLGYKTVSFHLGAETLTIDLNTAQLTEEEALKAESLANQIIVENRPIETKWVTEEELSRYPLRKETMVKEDIRLVIIPEFDYNGCGGTHPHSTGEVQVIKILDWERQKKNIRVEFVCGGRVVSELGRKQKILMGLTKLLNAPQKDMESAVERLLEQGKRLEKDLDNAKELLLRFEAKDLIEKNAESIGGLFENRTIQELQKLARYIIALDPGKLVFLVSKNENLLQIVCARGADRIENMRAVISSALALINGKGGGSDAFAQGGGEALVTGEQMLDYLAETVLTAK